MQTVQEQLFTEIEQIVARGNTAEVKRVAGQWTVVEIKRKVKIKAPVTRQA